MVDCGGGVLCVSLCRSFSDVKVCGCRSNLSSDTYGWYLVRLTNLDFLGWN